MKIIDNSIEEFLGETPIISATLRVTDTCNLHCIQCYSRANAKSRMDVLDTKEMTHLLEMLKSKNVMRLSITGGEPFTRPDMLEVLKKASDMEFEIYISTNGTIHNIDYSKFAEINLKVIQISIDGLRENHDKIRGEKDAFDKSLEFIKRVHEINQNISLGVAFTLMRANSMDVLKLYKLLNEYPVDVFSIVPVQLMGRSQADYIMEPVELSQIFQSLADYYRESNPRAELNFMVSPALVPPSMTGSKFEKGYICTYPYSIAVDANGMVSVCDGLLNEKEFRFEHFFSGIENLHSNECMKKILEVKAENLTGVCSKCKFLDICAGGCRADSYLTYHKHNASDVLCQKFYDAGVFPKENLIE